MRLLLWSIAIMVAASLIVWAFVEGRNELKKESEREKPVPSKPSTVSTPEGTMVLVDAETQRRIGLRTEPLRAAKRPPQAVAYGRLEEDPASTFVLRAPVSGTLRAAKDRPWPSVGQALEKGTVGAIEPRFDIARELAAAKAEAASAEADQGVAQSKLELAQVVLEGIRNANQGKNVIDSEQVIKEAELNVKVQTDTLNAAKVRVAAAKAALAAFPPTDPSDGSRLVVGLDASGEVVEVLARQGEAVQAGDALLRLARFDRLIARVTLPVGESCSCDLSGAQVVPIGWGGAPLAGRRTALVSSPDGQTFLFLVDARGTGLRPGLAVTAYLELPGAKSDGVEVPGPAVVRHLGKAWVYAQSADGKFVRREVPTDAPTSNGWFVASGLAAGTPVVVEGAQLLLSEELNAEIRVGEEGD